MSIDTAHRKDADTFAPKACPFCASPDIAATGKVTAASYYRCHRCGQVWHPERLGPGAIFNNGRFR
jgi:transposase-like protein